MSEAFWKSISYYTGRRYLFTASTGLVVDGGVMNAYEGRSLNSRFVLILEVEKNNGNLRREFFMNVYEERINDDFENSQRAKTETYTRRHRIAAKDLEKTILRALEG